MIRSPADLDLAALLDWYQAMGADEAVGETPVDWISRGGTDTPSFSMPRPQAEDGPPAASKAPAPSMARSERIAPPSTLPRPAAAPQPESNAEARAAAAAARSLDELGAALARFEGCTLKATAKNLCFYRGAARARLMLIGEAPGRDEDLEGRPFVGRAGQLLDKMLAAAGLTIDAVHITNIVYWRPPGNRTPTVQEAEACRPFLERQIELVAPEIILLLGGAAAKQILADAEGIMKLRGQWRTLSIASREVRTMATLHPAFLLRSPAHKRQAWRDILVAKSALQS